MNGPGGIGSARSPVPPGLRLANNEWPLRVSHKEMLKNQAVLENIPELVKQEGFGENYCRWQRSPRRYIPRRGTLSAEGERSGLLGRQLVDPDKEFDFHCKKKPAL